MSSQQEMPDLTRESAPQPELADSLSGLLHATRLRKNLSIDDIQLPIFISSAFEQVSCNSTLPCISSSVKTTSPIVNIIFLSVFDCWVLQILKKVHLTDFFCMHCLCLCL